MSGFTEPAKKHLGQNFLHEKGVIAKIVHAIDPQPGDAIVEIGPGQGALTFPLLDRHGAVTVGKTVFEAYFKMEKVEHTALSIAAARSLGGARTLTPEMLAKLMAVYTHGAEPPVPYPFPTSQG